MRHVDIDRTRKNDKLVGGRGATRFRTQRQRRFQLEALEDRRLMTILFTPQYGAKIAIDGGGNRLGTVSPGLPLYTIYWGSWWANTTDGQNLQTNIQNSLNSSYG
jgi:hypothetical protein